MVVHERRSTIVDVFIWIIILAVVIAALYAGFGGRSADVPANTVQREKLEDVPGFTNNCIWDEANYLGNISKVSSSLKSFYNKTGIQPYLYFKSYESGVSDTETNRETWAQKYYEDNIEAENGFFLVVFEPSSEYADDECVYVNGKRASSVMDAEAVDIFWAYFDSHWFSNETTDNAVIGMFDDTAKRIMSKPTNGWDFAKIGAVAVIVIAISVGVVRVVKEKNRRAKEKAEEDERILKTDINDYLE